MNEYFYPGIQITTCTARTIGHWNHQNLSAPYWRLYWNRNESAQVILNSQITSLDPEHLILIPPDTPFGSRNNGIMEHLYLHFIAPPPYTSLPPTIFRFPIDVSTRKHAEELYQIGSTAPLTSNRAVMLAFSLVYLALAEVPQLLLQHQNHDLRILRAIQLMEESLTLPPTNSTLARAAGMNINAFIRLFKSQRGVSPQAYSTARRIEKACLLLHHSDRSIKEIAEQIGYCDRYHFTRTFTRLRGVPPAEFRRQTCNS